MIPKIHADKIREYYEKFPELTFKNEGYEYIYEPDLSIEARIAKGIIEYLLRAYHPLVTKFNNFYPQEDDTQIVLRLQYNWDSLFVGVGYFSLDELSEK